MFDRERCEALMLDYVYGLLEPAEVADLEAYLSTHPDGEELRQRAEAWKRQLAVAAKSEFPELQFAPPTANATPTRSEGAKPKPQPEKMPAKPARNSSWSRWVLTGSALLLVLGFGIPGVWHLAGHWNKAAEAENLRVAFNKADQAHISYMADYSARRQQYEADETTAAIANNQIQLQYKAARDKAHREAVDEHKKLESQFEAALVEAHKAIQDKQFIVRFRGPESAQPGAPNEWTVELYRRNGARALPNKIEWVVKDQTGKEIYRAEKMAPTRAGFVEPPKIDLPVAFWEKVKPNSDLVMEVIAHDERGKANASANIKLARPVYITHLATDKPLYKPGETVFFRSLMLDRSTFTPPEQDIQLQFRITKPDGSVVAIDSGVAQLYDNPQQRSNRLIGPDKKPIRGIGCGEFVIGANEPGGEYKLSVVDITPTYDEVRRQAVNRDVVLETRKFNVAEYKPEIFEKTLEFDGKSYGPGDTVMVKFTASRTQGGKVKSGLVTASAQVDGQNIDIPATKTDDEGVARFKFVLPKNITKGEGTLSVTITDNDREPIHRPIPLVGRIINVEFFPEGGDLVIDVPSRVYFQATTPAGKPADIKGYITDGRETVAEVTTLTDAENPGVNRGQGVFMFTPRAGKTYYLKLTKPNGIIEPVVKQTQGPAAIVGAIGLGNLNGIPMIGSLPTGFALPSAKDDGVVLTALDPLTDRDQPIRIQLQTAKTKKTVVVGAYTRSRLVDHQRVELEPGKQIEVKLNPNSKAGGVTRLTVFEERAIEESKQASLIPLAERLVYRKPAEQLGLNVQPDQSGKKRGYNPGSQVSLEIFAINESEKPVPAIIMVAVVNQNVLTMADEKTGRLMPTHFLLASEVKKPEDLEYADFLISEDPKTAVQAAKALDLLLGTQGWRRFAEQTGPRPDPTNLDVDRMLVANGQKSGLPIETLRQEENRVIAEFKPKLGVSLRRIAENEPEMKIEAEFKAVVENAAVRLASARQVNEAVKAEAETVRIETSRLKYVRDEADRRHNEAVAGLRRYEEDSVETRSVLFAGFCLGLLVIAGGALIVGLTRKGRESAPWFASAAGAFGVCLTAVVCAVLVMRLSDDSRQMAMKESRDNTPGGATMSKNAPRAGTGRAKEFPAENADFLNAAEGANFGGVKGGGGGRGGLLVPQPGGGGLGGPVPGQVAPPMMAEPKAPGPQAKKDAGGPDPRFGGGPKKGKANFDPRRPNQDRADLNRLADDMAKSKETAVDGKNLQYRVEREEANKLAKIQNELRQRIQAGGFGRAGTAPVDFDQRDMMEKNAQERLLEQTPGFYVREYKFEKTSDANVRNDFTETVYWHPALIIPGEGRTQVNFALSDSIARYRVLVAGHTLDGRIGAYTTHIEARKPFTVDPKTPIEVNANDRIDMPVRFVNDSDVRRAVTFTVDPNNLMPIDPSLLQDGKIKDFVELNAEEKKRKIISFKPMKEGEATITILANSNPPEMPDNIARRFRVVPEGFPASGAASDLLEKRANVSIELPEQIVPGTLKIKLNVYPTTLSDLQAGLEGLLREPYGCFEQTSTSNYPNLLILEYLKSADQAKPELAQRAKDLLDKGYAKLVSFECPDSGVNSRRGFEWFGQPDQQHQALTAYGLLQFKDLSKVFKVDPALIQRTQTYLLAQRDGQGGFKRNARALDTFGRAPDHTTNAYIVWALVESDPDDKEGLDLTKEFAALKKQAKEDVQAKDDPYFLALVANSLMLRPTGGNREAAIAILEQIADKHLKNGSVEGAKTSITRSGGRDLQIETTALTVLGWLRSGEPTKFIKPVKEATKWIGQQRGGYGGFGSTQSTILALKALIEHTKVSKRPDEDGEIRLTIGGKTFKKPFTKNDQEVITLDLPADAFKSGVNDAAVEITTAQPYPFSLAWSCNTLKPQDTGKSAVEITTKLDRKNVAEGDMVKLDVTMKNKKNEGHGMAVAIVGLPGGTRIPADQKELTKLREDGKISYFEIRGRELILYWRSLAPNQTIDVSLGLICEIPGEYRGPASRGYLYYNADHKNWVDPLTITITPSNQPGFEDVASK
jgi:A-macroglobulin TED domain/Alpha-2-macroglobulin family